MASPPPADQVIQMLWARSASFARSLRSLVTLTPQQLDALHAATSRGFEIQDVDASRVSITREEMDSVLRVLKSVYSMQALERTPEELVTDMLALVTGSEGPLTAEEADARRPALLRLLSGRPDMDLENRRYEVEQSLLPLLMDVQMALDLRAMTTDEGDVKFVPVVVVRLDFDEPASGGADMAIFQLTPRGLTELKEAVAAAEELLGRVEDQRGEMLL